jgi:hypothetical protein
MKTTEIPTGGGGGNFTNYKLQPETQVVFIESFNLRFATHASATAGEVSLSMECRGLSIEGFEGFAWDKNDATKGKRDHQVGYVKASNFNFADKRIGEKDIERDIEIGRFMIEVMTALGCKEWLDSIDPEGIMNLELWFTKINAADAPWRNKPLRLCIACRQYWRPQDKYAQNDLFVVKWAKGQIRMEDGNIPLEESKVVKWDPNNSDHMERAVKPDLVKGFKGNADAPAANTNAVGTATDVTDHSDDIPF